MKYLTMSETLRQNGDRFAERAAAYMAAGKPEYAAGAMRKAQRNWDRAKLFDAPSWTAPLVAQFTRNVAEQIILGR